MRRLLCYDALSTLVGPHQILKIVRKTLPSWCRKFHPIAAMELYPAMFCLQIHYQIYMMRTWSCQNERKGPRRESSILGSHLLPVRVASSVIVNRMIIYQFLPCVYNRMLFFSLASSDSFLFNRSPLCKDRRSWKFFWQLVFKPFVTYPKATISIFFGQSSSMRSQLFSNSYVSSPRRDGL